MAKAITQIFISSAEVPETASAARKILADSCLRLAKLCLLTIVCLPAAANAVTTLFSSYEIDISETQYSWQESCWAAALDCYFRDDFYGEFPDEQSWQYTTEWADIGLVIGPQSEPLSTGGTISNNGFIGTGGFIFESQLGYSPTSNRQDGHDCDPSVYGDPFYGVQVCNEFSYMDASASLYQVLELDQTENFNISGFVEVLGTNTGTLEDFVCINDQWHYAPDVQLRRYYPGADLDVVTAADWSYVGGNPNGDCSTTNPWINDQVLTLDITALPLGAGEWDVFAGNDLSACTLAPDAWEYLADCEASQAQSETLNFSVTVVPIPPALWLFGSALGLLGWSRRARLRQ